MTATMAIAANIKARASQALKPSRSVKRRLMILALPKSTAKLAQDVKRSLNASSSGTCRKWKSKYPKEAKEASTPPALLQGQICESEMQSNESNCSLLV
jgi:hypothetical protein